MASTKTSNGNSESLTRQRLVQLALVRQAKPEAKTIRHYASSLSGFSDEVIAEACDEFEREVPGEFQPRFPALEALMMACRNIQAQVSGSAGPKFYCEDCRAEYGMLFFDAPRGRRLRGMEIVIAAKRYARPCPCGGTETDWSALRSRKEGRRAAGQ